MQVLILKGLKQEARYLCPSPDGLHLAVGYEDGSIRIFSLLNGEANVTFNGHKAAVTAMQYDQLGGRLVSGSKVRLAHLGGFPFTVGRKRDSVEKVDLS